MPEGLDGEIAESGEQVGTEAVVRLGLVHDPSAVLLEHPKVHPHMEVEVVCHSKRVLPYARK